VAGRVYDSSVAYSTRAAEHTARRDEHRARSRLIATMRLSALVIGVACIIWRMNGGPPWLGPAAFAFAGAFGALIIWHARVDTRAEWHEASRIVNERALARVERRWDDLPAADAPPEIDLTDHPYALDLDLFGRASLYQWIGPPATPSGRAQLAGWLLAGESADVVRERQSATLELAPMDQWREEFAAHGLLARGAGKREIDAFITWAGDATQTMMSPALRFFVYALTLAIWITGGLWLAKRHGAAQRDHHGDRTYRGRSI
jgi:hypothetical protein